VTVNLQLQIILPQIKEETMEEMKKFFMKTSIPRIIEEKTKKQHEKEDGCA